MSLNSGTQTSMSNIFLKCKTGQNLLSWSTEVCLNKWTGHRVIPLNCAVIAISMGCTKLIWISKWTRDAAPVVGCFRLTQFKVKPMTSNLCKNCSILHLNYGLRVHFERGCMWLFPGAWSIPSKLRPSQACSWDIQSSKGVIEHC